MISTHLVTKLQIILPAKLSLHAFIFIFISLGNFVALRVAEKQWELWMILNVFEVTFYDHSSVTQRTLFVPKV